MTTPPDRRARGNPPSMITVRGRRLAYRHDPGDPGRVPLVLRWSGVG